MANPCNMQQQMEEMSGCLTAPTCSKSVTMDWTLFSAGRMLSSTVGPSSSAGSCQAGESEWNSVECDGIFIAASCLSRDLQHTTSSPV